MKDFCTRPATDSGIVRDRGALFSVGVCGGGGKGQVAKILGGAENMNTRSRARRRKSRVPNAREPSRGVRGHGPSESFEIESLTECYECRNN